MRETKKGKREDQNSKEERREKDLRDEILSMTQQNRKLNNISSNMKETDGELEKNRKEREERTNVIDQLREQCEASSDREIEKLQEERMKLQKKKEKRGMKVVESVLKRQAITDIDMKDVKIPKKL